MRVEAACPLSISGRRVPAILLNLSADGALFRAAPARPEPVSDDDLGIEATFTLTSVTPARRYTGEIIRRYVKDDAHHVALRFWDPYEEVAPSGH